MRIMTTKGSETDQGDYQVEGTGERGPSGLLASVPPLPALLPEAVLHLPSLSSV